MNRPPASLRVMLPAGLAAAFLLITAISLINAIHNHRETVTDNARSDALGYATEVARIIEQGGLRSPVIVKSRISHILTDPRVETVTVTNPRMEVLLSPRQAQTGRPVTEVLPGFEPDAVRGYLERRLPGLLAPTRPTRIEAVQSFAMPGAAATADPSNRGLVFVRLDIAGRLDTIRNEAVLNGFPRSHSCC